MGRTRARDPVAMMAFLKLRLTRLPCASRTSTVFALVNWPSPKNTSTPNSVNRWAESWWLMPARTRRMRCITAAKSTWGVATFTPNATARCISPITLAERMMVFDGTHPLLRQSPPIQFFSIKATLPPNPAAAMAEISPAEPAPMTTKLYLACGVGLCHSGGCTWASNWAL